MTSRATSNRVWTRILRRLGFWQGCDICGGEIHPTHPYCRWSGCPHVKRAK